MAIKRTLIRRRGRPQCQPSFILATNHPHFTLPNNPSPNPIFLTVAVSHSAPKPAPALHSVTFPHRRETRFRGERKLERNSIAQKRFLAFPALEATGLRVWMELAPFTVIIVANQPRRGAFPVAHGSNFP